MTRRNLQSFLHIAALAAACTPGLASAATRSFIAFAVPPTTSSEATQAGIDLDGDGGVDNQLGSAFAALESSFPLFDFSETVTTGKVVYLVRVTSTDATFQNDPAARADWIIGRPTAPVPPDFSGNGSFLLDGAYPPGTFIAPLTSSALLSANPVTTTTPVGVPLQLYLGGRIVLALQGARVTFTIGANGLTAGQINGSITDADIDNIMVPSIADRLNQIIAAGGPDADNVRNTFDDGCNGVGANDGFIAVCEVQDSIFGTLLQPDVDVFDNNGNYAPNPAGTNPESISFGMRFTAANAQVPLEVVFANSFE